MFSVAVKDHIMIAHSFRGAVFGPAQRMHGATFVITTEYRTATLDDDGIVIDIGRAHEVLSQVLERSLLGKWHAPATLHRTHVRCQRTSGARIHPIEELVDLGEIDTREGAGGHRGGDVAVRGRRRPGMGVPALGEVGVRAPAAGTVGAA